MKRIATFIIIFLLYPIFFIQAQISFTAPTTVVKGQATYWSHGSAPFFNADINYDGYQDIILLKSTDIFYKSTANQHQDQTATPGIYDAYAIAVQYNVTLVGNIGTLNITEVGILTRVVTFNTN